MDTLYKCVIGIIIVITMIHMLRLTMKIIPVMSQELVRLSKYNVEQFNTYTPGLYEYPQFTPQGVSVPLKTEDPPTEIHTNGTSVDGTPNTTNSMFMFSQNQCKAECCPSTYSCDKGCICPTENQKNFICNKGISN